MPATPEKFRYTGHPIALKPVAPGILEPVQYWCRCIPLSNWPQQSNGLPAMVNKPEWFGFYQATNLLLAYLTDHILPESIKAQWGQRMLSVVMPGESIPWHRDEQPPNWLCRLHIPLQTDHLAVFCTQVEGQGRVTTMREGVVYAVDTLAEHCVANHSPSTPRIHFMVDILS